MHFICLISVRLCVPFFRRVCAIARCAQRACLPLRNTVTGIVSRGDRMRMLCAVDFCVGIKHLVSHCDQRRRTWCWRHSRSGIDQCRHWCVPQRPVRRDLSWNKVNFESTSDSFVSRSIDRVGVQPAPKLHRLHLIPSNSISIINVRSFNDSPALYRGNRCRTFSSDRQ